MRYVGGKSKLARHIAATIAERRDDRDRYIEPFMGGGSTFAAIAPMFSEAYGGDIVPDLALMWSALLDGWTPHAVTEAEYAALRHDEPSAIRAFAGFGGSFGGKWFGGYARGGVNADGTPRNHQAESARTVTRLRDRLGSSDVKIGIWCCEFDAWDFMVTPETVVYLDPPYAGATGYAAAGVFDSAGMWATASKWTQRGALVLVSEYVAPAGWHAVWTGAHRQSLQHGASGRPVVTEQIFALDDSMQIGLAA